MSRLLKAQKCIRSGAIERQALGPREAKRGQSEVASEHRNVEKKKKGNYDKKK